MWWPGNESPWEDSWIDDDPLELSDEAFRHQATGITQVINGRFSAYRDGTEIVAVEAVDSSFWLVWSDDATILGYMRGRFPKASPASPPSPFHPYG